MAQLKTKTINKNRQYQMRNIFKVVEDRIVTFIVCLVLWLGLVAGKSCNFWVSCNIWVLQPVGYCLYWQNVIGSNQQHFGTLTTNVEIFASMLLMCQSIPSVGF